MRQSWGGIWLMVFVLVVPNVYGAGPMMTAAKEGGEPMAVMLVDQGISLYNENDMGAALKSFEMAVEIDPSLSVAYFNAGIVASEMGQKKEALSYIEQFLTRMPGHREGEQILSELKASYYAGILDAEKGGFAEFGMAALIGSLFPLAMAAYMAAKGRQSPT